VYGKEKPMLNRKHLSPADNIPDVDTGENDGDFTNCAPWDHFAVVNDAVDQLTESQQRQLYERLRRKFTIWRWPKGKEPEPDLAHVSEQDRRLAWVRSLALPKETSVEDKAKMAVMSSWRAWCRAKGWDYAYEAHTQEAKNEYDRAIAAGEIPDWDLMAELDAGWLEEGRRRRAEAESSPYRPARTPGEPKAKPSAKPTKPKAEPKSKLTDADIAEAQALLAGGTSMRAVARMFTERGTSITDMGLRHILNGKAQNDG
jgi:hypothetical protein